MADTDGREHGSKRFRRDPPFSQRDAHAWPTIALARAVRAGQSIANYKSNSATSGFQMCFCYLIPVPVVPRVPTNTRRESSIRVLVFKEVLKGPYVIYDCFFQARCRCH